MWLQGPIPCLHLQFSSRAISAVTKCYGEVLRVWRLGACSNSTPVGVRMAMFIKSRCSRLREHAMYREHTSSSLFFGALFLPTRRADPADSLSAYRALEGVDL